MEAAQERFARKAKAKTKPRAYPGYLTRDRRIGGLNQRKFFCHKGFS
jgi:hypothetical protein